MKITLVPLDQITPFDRNPRNHDVDAIAASIKTFGWRQPIVIDADGVIIAGHGRFFAAQMLGEKKVPAHYAHELTPEQIRAYRLADNRTHDLSVWDMDLLRQELTSLQELDVDLALLGFSDDFLALILAADVTAGNTDPDEIPSPPDEATTKPGDTWALGNHRLLCGDSSKPEDVDRLLAGQVIHLVNTDPPYNVKVEPRSNNAIAAGITSFSRREDIQCERSKSARGKKDRERKHHQQLDLARHPKKAKATHKKMRAKDRPLANDFVTDAEFDVLLDAWFGNISRVLKPGGSFYIWGGYANLGNYPPFLKKNGLYFSQGIVWDKQHPVLTRKDFMGAFELAFYGWKEGAGHKFYGPNNASDLWHVKKVNPQSMVHLTEKPVELAVRALQYSSRPGEHVLDLFGGSGSTLIAAEQTGRKAYLLELDALYCDVIVKRWEQFTGNKAIRLGETKSKAKKGGPRLRARAPAKKKRLT